MMLHSGTAVINLAVLLLLLTVGGAATTASAACTLGDVPADAPAALVFSGGGARGAWEAGVAAALIERGVPVRAVAGSSSGALNAVMVADGRIDRMEALWRSLTRDQVYSLRPSVFFAGLLPGWLSAVTLSHTTSLLDPTPLRELLGTAVDLERVRSSRLRLVVVTTDLARREARLFDNQTITHDALLATVSVPGLFPPVAVNGAPLVDGGLVARAPVLEALATGVPVQRAIVTMAYAPAERPAPPRRLREVFEDAFETLMVHQIQRDADLGRLRHRVDVQVVEPSAPLLLRPLDFESSALSDAVARGRADGTRCLDAWSGRH
jgi:NTE family protein